MLSYYNSQRGWSFDSPLCVMKRLYCLPQKLHQKQALVVPNRRWWPRTGAGDPEQALVVPTQQISTVMISQSLCSNNCNELWIYSCRVLIEAVSFIAKCDHLLAMHFSRRGGCFLLELSDVFVNNCGQYCQGKIYSLCHITHIQVAIFLADNNRKFDYGSSNYWRAAMTIVFNILFPNS